MLFIGSGDRPSDTGPPVGPEGPSAAARGPRSDEPARGGPTLAPTLPPRGPLRPGPDHGILAPLFELPRLRLSDHSAALFAKYFARVSTAAERAELAGVLIFPVTPGGAKIVERAVRGRLRIDERAKLQGSALFPRNERAAELVAQRTVGKPPLTQAERIELVAACAFPDNPVHATQMRGLLQRAVSAVESEPVDSATRREAAVEFVRREVESGARRFASVTELKELFGVPKTELQELIDEALTDEQRRFRDEALLAARAENNHAVENILVSAVRTLVALENDLYRIGVVDRLSSKKELARLFGIAEQEVAGHLRFLPHGDGEYREFVLDQGAPTEMRRELVRSVREEVVQFARDQGTIRTDTDIAAQLKVQPATVYLILEKHLPPDVRAKRDFILTTHDLHGPHLRSPLSLVRAELEAFRLGEVDRIHTDAELAALFRTNELTIYDSLRAPSKGLDLEELRVRHFILALQRPQDPASQALRELVTRDQREQIEKHWPARKIKVLQGGSPATRSQRVVYRGQGFDSIEEAACAQLMEKYIRGFVLQTGDTHQIQIGDRFIDFRVRGIFVEYHPILLFWNRAGLGSFDSLEDYRTFQRIKKGLSVRERKLFVEDTKMKMAAEYFERREAIIDSSAKTSGSELVLALSPQDFYFSVVKRFGEPVPSLEQFTREFNSIKRRVKRENGRGSVYEAGRIAQRKGGGRGKRAA